MNLIEKLGIEKCKAIVDGAPEGAEYWRDMDSVCSPNEILYYRWFACALIVRDTEKGWIKSIYHDGSEYILDQLQDLKDLRTAIANHGTPTNEGADNFSHFDHCSDIRNHISPNTVVIER